MNKRETKKNDRILVREWQRHPVTRVPVKMEMTVTSEYEAARARTELKRKLHQRFETEMLKLRGGKMSYRELLSRFQTSLKDRDLSQATIDNYMLCLNAHTLKLWGHRPIDEILPDEIRNLIRIKLADRSKSHQKSMLKFLRGVFNFAMEAGHMQKSPVPFMQFRFERKLKQVLNETQANMLLERAKQYEHEWYPHWSVALYTGMRNEEQFALRWQNVDLENRLIFVREVWTKKDGFKQLTKSGEDRVVEIAQPLMTILKELKLKNTDSVFVLPRIDAWEVGRQAEILRTFCMGLNLPPISYHALRATWATLMLSKGVEPVKVMKMGGWMSLKTLEKHYIRLSGVDIRGMTDRLNLHDPSKRSGELLAMPIRSNL